MFFQPPIYLHEGAECFQTSQYDAIQYKNISAASKILESTSFCQTGLAEHRCDLSKGLPFGLSETMITIYCKVTGNTLISVLLLVNELPPLSCSHVKPTLGILLPVGISRLKWGHRARLSLNQVSSLSGAFTLCLSPIHNVHSVHLFYVGVSICFCKEKDCYRKKRPLDSHRKLERGELGMFSITHITCLWNSFVYWPVCVLTDLRQIPDTHEFVRNV